MDQPSSNAWSDEIAVLEAGLPPLPAHLGDDEAVPIARWLGPRFAAILFVMRSGESDDPDRYISSEIYVFRRNDRGWESINAGGGGGWFDPPFVRPDVDGDFASLVHFHSCSELDQSGEGVRWTYSSAYGYAGTAAKTVEVEDDDGLSRREIESPLGVFIVVAGGTGRADVRVRRDDGSLLLERELLPPRWQRSFGEVGLLPDPIQRAGSLAGPGRRPRRYPAPCADPDRWPRTDTYRAVAASTRWRRPTRSFRSDNAGSRG